MKVRELMALLARCEPEATVRIANQPSYPVEHALEGVATKIEEDGEVVLLLEGAWAGYGSREAWAANLAR